MTDPILEITNVSKRFTRMPSLAERLVGKVLGGGKPVTVHALSDVSLSVMRGEVLGLLANPGAESLLWVVSCQASMPRATAA